MEQPVCAQKAPFKLVLEAGKDYWWCACGRSAKQPFCDGSHKAVGLAPLKYTAQKPRGLASSRVSCCRWRSEGGWTTFMGDL